MSSFGLAAAMPYLIGTFFGILYGSAVVVFLGMKSHSVRASLCVGGIMVTWSVFRFLELEWVPTPPGAMEALGVDRTLMNDMLVVVVIITVVGASVLIAWRSGTMARLATWMARPVKGEAEDDTGDDTGDAEPSNPPSD